MKYKVVKDFDSLKKGDVLTNSSEDPEIFSFEEETDNTYKYVSYNKTIIDELVKNKYLTLIEVEDEQVSDYSDYLEDKICSTIDEIDRLLEQYERDNETVHDKFGNNEVPYCAVVEADTVHKNLSKVLSHIKDLLTLDEQTCKDN